MSKVVSDPKGILLLDALDDHMKKDDFIEEPWIGILHNCIDHPPTVGSMYGTIHDLDLRRMVRTLVWERNIDLCRGLVCLSEHSAGFLRSHTNVPVCTLTHATGTPTLLANPEEFLRADRAVLMVGHWMRNFQAFFDLPTPRRKILLSVPSAFNYNNLASMRMDPDLTILPRQPDEEYDRLLAKNIVFLNLHASSACNTVIECIVRNTPILVNRLPALEEYLGHDYPLFYDNMDHAAALTTDAATLLKGHLYLVAMPKERFSPDHFANGLRLFVESLQ